jgi:hypothetical protein
MRYAMRSRYADPLQWTWLDNSGLDADRRFTQNMTRIVSRQKRPEITEIVFILAGPLHGGIAGSPPSGDGRPASLLGLKDDRE